MIQPASDGRRRSGGQVTVDDGSVRGARLSRIGQTPWLVRGSRSPEAGSSRYVRVWAFQILQRVSAAKTASTDLDDICCEKDSTLLGSNWRFMAVSGNLVRDPRARRTRQRLQDALRKLLGEKPLDEILIQDVADAAEVNRATFYDHYSDKFDLFNGLDRGGLPKAVGTAQGRLRGGRCRGNLRDCDGGRRFPPTNPRRSRGLYSSGFVGTVDRCGNHVGNPGNRSGEPKPAARRFASSERGDGVVDQRCHLQRGHKKLCPRRHGMRAKPL